MLRTHAGSGTTVPTMISPTMRIPLLLGLLVLVAAGGILFVQEEKKLSLEANLKLIKLKNLRIGVGSYGNKKGTGLFGSLVNEGKETVSIATLLVSFVDDTGQIVKTHEFSLHALEKPLIAFSSISLLSFPAAK